MKNTIKNTTMLAFVAGAIAGPIIYYILRRNKAAQTADSNYGTATHPKKMFAAYRGEHKPHHRKADNNGHLN